jgi:hypothetical protein
VGPIDGRTYRLCLNGNSSEWLAADGLVPAVYDPKTKLVTYVLTQKLVPKMYIVILTAKVNGKKVETRWDFTVDLAGPVATNR